MFFTKEQQKAIEDLDNNLLITSGPGSGKTSVILAKTAYLLENNYSPEDIIITSYTNKTKEELKARLPSFCNLPPHNITICTIHGLCRLIIKEFANSLTYQILYLMDELDIRFFLINNYKNLSIKEESFSDRETLFKYIFNLFSFFDNLNEHNISSKKLKHCISEHFPNRNSLNSLMDKGVLLRDKDILNILGNYRKFIWNEKLLDFSQTLKLTYNILRKNEEVRKILSRRYKYIIVDEYQDVSYLQHKIYKLLVSQNNRICVVGDDDQGLYEFRGASVYNIINFKEDFPRVRVLRIGENFRSTENIVSFSASIIKYIDNRYEKELVSQKGDKDNVILIEAKRPEDLAYSISQAIKKLIKENLVSSYSDIALLFHSVRWQFIGEGYKNIFEKENIPFNINKSGNFFEEEPIDLFTTILNLILQEGFFHTELINILEKIELEDITIILAKIPKEKKINFSEIEPNKLKYYYNLNSSKDIEKLKKIYFFYKKIKDNPKTNIMELIYDLFNLTPHLKKAIINRNIPKEKYILLQIAYFSQLAKYYTRWGKHSISSFIENISILKDKRRIDAREQKDKNAVNITTIHSSKGLEYKAVFICDFKISTYKQGGFNIPKELINQKYNYNNALHQQIRLFYTAITRAKDYLFLAYPQINKYKHRNQRHFIIEKALRENNIHPSNIEELSFINDNQNKNKNKPTDKDKESISLTFSKIQSYLLCPLSYELEHIYGFRTKESFNASFGKLVHSVLEQMHFIALYKKSITKEKIKEILYKQIDRLNIDDNKIIDIYKKEAKDILLSYFKTNYNTFKPDIKEIEKDFEVYTGSNRINLKIDLILNEENNKISIIDFKTGKDNIATEKQLLMYTHSLRILGYNISKISSYYLRENKIVSYEIDEKKIKDIEKEINEIFEALSKKVFDAEPNPKNCLYCNFNKICPYDANKNNLNKISPL